MTIPSQVHDSDIYESKLYDFCRFGFLYVKKICIKPLYRYVVQLVHLLMLAVKHGIEVVPNMLDPGDWRL